MKHFKSYQLYQTIKYEWIMKHYTESGGLVPCVLLSDCGSLFLIVHYIDDICISELKA